MASTATPEEIDNVGNVSQSRYEQIVAELRDVVEQQTRGQFTIGDRALEIEPMREPGGHNDVDPEWSVTAVLTRLAEDIGLKFSTVKSARWTSSRWPVDRRRKGVSFTVHRILAYIEIEEERFAAILALPEDKVRWTVDDARRRVSNRVETPVTPKEKITAIHTPAQDDQVAAAVTGDFLKRPEMTAKVTRVDKARVVDEFTRDEQVATSVATNLPRRPDVAFKVMSDDTARFQANHAQAERSRQARDRFEDTSPVAPAVRHIDRTVEFLDLVTACHAFVAAAGRAVPGLRDRTLGEDERTIVHENVAKVRATLDWIETAVDTGKVDMDGELARMLKGEWSYPAPHGVGATRLSGMRHAACGMRTPCGSCCSRPGPRGCCSTTDRRFPTVSQSDQVRSGLAWPGLRGIIAENGWPTLIRTRADGYLLGAEPVALQAYERAVLTGKLTEFRRFLTGTVAPHAAAHPGDKWVKHIIAQLNSVESTLNLVVSS